MQPGLELTPIPLEERRASILDVALLFAGANVVATTLVTGGSLGELYRLSEAATLILFGALFGTLPIALLARLGPRTGLPSMVLVRQPFGLTGAAAVSAILVSTNFAWIALNNVIAASALSRLLGGPEAGWSLGVGALATLVAMTGPRAMVLFDRVAIPAMALVGVGLTLSLLRQPPDGLGAAPATGTSNLWVGLDVVIGYQVSWSLMFADYTRYQRRASSASLAVLVGLFFSSSWLMLVGAAAGRLGSNDPTEMIVSLGLPIAALAIVVLSTVTTNFVNLYLSSLAVKNLYPPIPSLPTVIGIGSIGTALGLLSPRLLERFAGFMEILGTLLLPIVAILVVHFFTGRRSERAEARQGLEPRAVVAWLAGASTYRVIKATLPDLGATLPTLLVAGLLYALLRRAPLGSFRDP